MLTVVFFDIAHNFWYIHTKRANPVPVFRSCGLTHLHHRNVIGIEFAAYAAADKPLLPYERASPTVQSILVSVNQSILDWFGGEILLYHQGDLEGNRMLKLTQIKTGQLADFFQTINKRVSVDKQLA